MSLLRAWVEFQGHGVERENSDRVQWNSSGDEMELQGLGEPNIYGSQDRVMNNTGMSSYIQVFLGLRVFIFLGYIPKSVSMGSY